MWIVDFGTEISESEAALYEAPYQYAFDQVRPRRVAEGSRTTRTEWWLHERPRVEWRRASLGLARYLATIRHSKHRLWVWLGAETLPDSALVVVARDDEYTFGVLHSRVHELWALRTGTQLETRPRYTPTTTFETFPFPRPTDAQREAIATVAKRLNELREGWLNPAGASDEELEKRTLTNLYNERPAWLRDAHEALDRAVIEAYGWPADISDDDILSRLLDENLSRSGAARDP
jgi:hypothetical protein